MREQEEKDLSPHFGNTMLCEEKVECMDLVEVIPSGSILLDAE